MDGLLEISRFSTFHHITNKSKKKDLGRNLEYSVNFCFAGLCPATWGVYTLGRNSTKLCHTEAIAWTSLCIESISKIPRKSLTLPCVAAITLLT